jgi:DnaK suppressor protein
VNLELFKKQLLAKASELRRNKVSKDEIAIERNAEMVDEIQRTTEREIALGHMSRNWKTAADVAGALSRIAEGTYGICVGCEDEISERRLTAIPWAKYCIQCQERADRDSKQEAGQLSEAA